MSQTRRAGHRRRHRGAREHALRALRGVPQPLHGAGMRRCGHRARPRADDIRSGLYYQRKVLEGAGHCGE